MPKQVCTFPDCERPVKYKGLCNGHYKQQREGRLPLKPLVVRTKKLSDFCAFPGCVKPNNSRGLCRSHAKQKSKGQELRELRTLREPECGTTRGYSRHVYRRERPCDACTTANREATRRYRHGGVVPPEQGACDLCGSVGPLHVHHWHGCCDGGFRSCGECFLGFLCTNCNTGMGLFMDDPALLRRAAEWQEAALYRMGMRDRKGVNT